MTEQQASAPDAAPGEGWWAFRGTGQAPAGEPPVLPDPPPWREFAGAPLCEAPPGDPTTAERRLGGLDPRATLGPEELATVNAAVLLRRPLLVTGAPGLGKSSLAHLIARELGLGRVLEWNIVSRSTLRGGLNEYDAIGRAQSIAAWRAARDGIRDAIRDGSRDSVRAGRSPRDGEPEAGTDEPPALGDFLTLGPLGTALLPFERPRVLLIDELDKADLDLPNDLLHVLENGSYEIPELVRSRESPVSVFTDDPGRRAEIRHGRVECRAFPIVVITSNGEREFPAALRRRCLPLEMRPPTREQLVAVVASHLRRRPEGIESLLDEFHRRSSGGGTHTIDQLLNAVHMVAGGYRPEEDDRTLLETLLRDLSKGR
ncbi:MoxR family ATPase [Streptacidiphilus pinicola]|uniref:MoxR family ATPase n=1 Tax=Streptacidiphilus pinicola TaxID=2219663 RepID=A0A2X0K3E1_9ACTN|nr:AAA family ATPase [Streptacidiphilus pinicola]RAG83775.1 MoxR family ATPase [Streptacidiphilus pinicola]